MDDRPVLRRFSAGAARYDGHAHAQRLSGQDLLDRTVSSFADGGMGGPQGVSDAGAGRVGTILEPGCGTGLYTEMLLAAFPGASIIGVDLSEAMVRLARRRIRDPRARFVVADAERIPGGTYDLISSNATFQWFLSFPRTVARMASLLEPGGVLTFSFFGRRTYTELDEAIEEGSEGRTEPGGGARVSAAAFLAPEEIAAALSAVFPRWEIEERTYRQEFPSLAELLRSIRYTGAWGGGRGGGWSRGRLARVEAAYRQRHGGIRATYQVFLCRGGGGEAG